MATRRSLGGALEGFSLEGVESVDDLVEHVSALYGKPIFLEPLDEAAWGPLTAFLDESPEDVSVYFRAQDSPQYRLQCICHELGHLVLGTDCCALAVDESVASQVEVSTRSIRVQARDLRDTPEEREVEEFAFGCVRHLRSVGRMRSRAAQIWA